MYKQLEDKLQREIDEGKWEAGTQLPSESELMQLHSVSRATVRQAVDGLARKGRVYKRQGLGTFVTNIVFEQSLPHMSGFSADALARGLIPKRKILDFHMQKAPNAVAEKLALGTEDDVLYLSRLGIANDKTVLVDYTYISGPWLSSNGIDITAEKLGSGSLYSLLRDEYGITFYYGLLNIRAENAGKKEASILGCPIHFATLVSEITTYLEDGTPVEYTKAIARHDRHQWTIPLWSLQIDRPSVLENRLHIYNK